MARHDRPSANPASTADATAALKLDVVSDTICPWCYVGKRRLAAALAELAGEGLAFEVTWRPFQLNPTMPKEGLDRRDYRTRKFGSWERSKALDVQVAAAGAEDGLTFRHDLMTRTPNTLASHALIRLAHDLGGTVMQDAVVELLFVAYFTGGRDVGDHRVLAEIGEEAGLGRANIDPFLSDAANLEAVVYDENLARGLGLNGVPSFVFDGRFLFSGAQPVTAICNMLREAAAAHLASGNVASSKEDARVLT
ncbi:MAG: DsbA family oxidoreductase [Pseudomonadota bacterium]